MGDYGNKIAVKARIYALDIQVVLQGCGLVLHTFRNLSLYKLDAFVRFSMYMDTWYCICS